jgi:hypothetical protein
VGTWLVTYTGALAGQAFIQWHNDGTEWENIDYPILGGTICMGDWKATDENHVRRSHVGWTYANGIPSGHFIETETDEVSRDGRSYRGTNNAKFYDLEGNMVAEAGGTAVATRISPPCSLCLRRVALPLPVVARRREHDANPNSHVSVSVLSPRSSSNLTKVTS